MKRLLCFMFAVVALLPLSCGRRAEVAWRDGNFAVYATDEDFKATRLAYDHHPGMLGLVGAEVVAAGSTAQLVFVERIDRSTGRTEFYVIPKEESKDSPSGKVEGPFSAMQFREIRHVRQLPEFTWRKKWGTSKCDDGSLR